ETTPDLLVSSPGSLLLGFLLLQLLLLLFFAISFALWSPRMPALAITKANGSYSDIFAAELSSGALFIPLDCAADPSLFPFPARTPHTLLNRVLRRGAIRSFDVVDAGLDTLLNLMISIISNHYGVPLKRVVVPFPDNSTIAIEMLIDGIVDLAGPDFSLGGEFMGIARKRVTQQSCVQLNGLGVFTVLDTSPFTSFASLLAATTLTTITNAEGSATLYASVMPNLDVTLNPDLTDAEIVAALRDGTIDVVIDLDVGFLASEGVDVTGLRSFSGGFDTPNGSLFAIRCLPRRHCSQNERE
ncbi:uncharacterized protein ACA1_073960, partial [Acanthamoeba castellanii str. Neff]